MRLASPWRPRLAEIGGLAHERLVDALAADIADGTVPEGARLPPHRELAFQLGIGLGTVTKAYAVLERRGLVHSQHGRGMFVAGTVLHARASVDLSVNTPPQMLGDRLMAATLARLAKRLNAESFGSYRPAAGSDQHRMLMAQWLADHRLVVPPDRLLLTNGAQHALSIAFALACRPGGLLLTEAVTYPGAIALARQAGYRMAPLAMDDEGLRPDALEQALRRRTGAGTPAALYVTPTLQNPTAATMGLTRRQAIVRICRVYDVTIVEDDVYSLFTPPDLPALAELAPERTLYVNGFSKNLSPGLRIGVLATPPALIGRALALLQTTCTMASPLCCLIMEQWLTDGTAASVGASVRGEADRRRAMVRAALPVGSVPASGGFHAWLPMPPAQARRLADAAATMGVMITPPAAVMVDPAADPCGIRLCLGAPPPEALARALDIVGQLLVHGTAGDRAMTAVI